MSYARFVVSKTGLFPKMALEATNVLDVANSLSEMARSKNYYYFIPARYDIRSLMALADTFTSNGVLLVPHRSRHYQRIVFRVPKRNQEFLSDVWSVYRNRENYQAVLAKYNKRLERR